MNDINGVIGYRRVNSENMHEMADWCGGVIRTTDEETPRPYVQVNELDIAFTGDWVINTKDGFKSMSDEELKDLEADKSRYEQVLKIVMDVLLEQHAATYHHTVKPNRQDRAKKATEKIIQKIMEIM